MSRRYCTRWGSKIRYSTYKRAVRVASSLFDRGQTEVLNTAYFCRICAGWHLTSGKLMSRRYCGCPTPTSTTSGTTT